ncbi:MAG: hypothetical protein KH336_02605 [Faecalibacterium prausnitzii]|nr:hypothetical protein [Faecalibacterium prausnitzii]
MAVINERREIFFMENSFDKSMVLWSWRLVSYNQLQSILSNSLSLVGCYGNGSANLCDGKNRHKNRVRPPGRTLPKATDDSDMYNREFPSGGNFLFFFSCKMSLFRLPCSKLPLAFLAVPAGKDGRVKCSCQTVDDFIGVRGSVCAICWLNQEAFRKLTAPH